MPEPQPTDVYALFEALVDLPPAEQKALLEQSCADDPALLEELRELLAADQRVGAMTARPLVDELARAMLTAAPAVSFSQLRVGPFEVREELGHGGMGVVYRAERVDGSVEQQVAIKFVRRELLSNEVRARFLQERQTLAAMDHPNIARLIDAAELDDGTPYYVMEYVRGVPITEYCERERLSLRDRIALFRTVCEAVAYAHRNLVVHRDLKPGNILITADGVPKLLDFGIAKLLQADGTANAPEQTVTEQRYFSPSYAAPEQLLGQPITVGCDVYALGLLLCECLTGQRAFDFAGLSAGQIERLITSVPPPPPSQLATQSGASPAQRRQLSGDLDGIVLRCLRKAVPERYASVEQLSADLDNYLDGRPVHARGGHLWHGVRKFLRRNWVPVSTGTAAVVALIGGILAFAIQARIAEQRAEELERVSSFQARMLSSIDPALAGDSLSNAVARDHLKALEAAELSGIDHEDRLSLFREEWSRLNSTDLVRELVDETLIKPAVTSVQEGFSDQPLVAAQLYLALAQTYLRLGSYKAALPLLGRAVDLNQTHLGKHHLTTLTAMYWLGKTYYDIQKNDQALATLQESVAGLRRVGNTTDALFITVVSALSSALTQAGRFEEAEVLVEEVLALEAASRIEGDLWYSSVESIDAVQRLGLYYLRHQLYSDAEPHLRRAVDARERLLGENHQSTHAAISQLVVTLMHLGRWVEAEKYSTEIVGRTLQVYGEQHAQTSTQFLNHGAILARLDKFKESEEYFRRAVAIREQIFGHAHPDTLLSRSSLGLTIQLQGRLSDADSYYSETLEISRKSLGDNDPETLVALQNLASLRLQQGRAHEALALLEPIEAATRKEFRAGRMTARYLMSLGMARLELGNFAAAEPSLLEAYTLFQSVADFQQIEEWCSSGIAAQDTQML